MNKFHKDMIGRPQNAFQISSVRMGGFKPKLLGGEKGRQSLSTLNYRFWFLSPASGWFVEWAFKQIMANMGRYHVRHHVANPLIARPQSSYNKMIQPPDRIVYRKGSKPSGNTASFLSAQEIK